ncbi:aspartyl protease family protein 1 isoform X1 [Coffea eugenioides]|uniref:aspartyl protease family protein 1 isoform X1 n=1 Tax=Coffea eugenioides TaxID=49369 RepID=UPI000F615422|nr:aspartyl protease family protein 1 isoform X1 [Coffea eugenioides]
MGFLFSSTSSSCRSDRIMVFVDGKVLVFMGFIMLISGIHSSEASGSASGTFGFDIHHRYSNPVRSIFDFDGLPEKHSFDYYAAMAHRDRYNRGRYLAGTTTPVTFVAGNDTLRLNSLGFLYYANVSVGTPELWFLVALDTGSDLFWLPCDCTSCVRGLVTRSGKRIDFNMYSLNTSSTGMTVPCNSTMCDARRRACLASRKACAYEVSYLSGNTSSTGLLVEDVLHLATDDSQQKVVDAPITLGCGIVQTGGFLDGAAPNGLFGLGMDTISVPSTLASKGLAANSFSMCFGNDGVGRIVFGDKGSTDQGETPFNLHQLHPAYNISITQIAVGANITDVDFTAIFDSGTSFTYVNDPAYSIITENFNSRVQQPRYPSDSQIPFEFCYNLSPNETGFDMPSLNLTMKGGDPFSITNPSEIFQLSNNRYIYCLAVVKSGDVNIIGQNFMTGYRVVFNRENMTLGWKPSNCYDDVQTKNGSNTLPVNQRNGTQAPSPSTLVPEATSGKGSTSPVATAIPTQSPPGSNAPDSNSISCKILVFLFCLLSHYLIILSY